MTGRTRHRRIGLLAAALLFPSLAAAELQLSGFGTLGGAVSDQDFAYLRNITDDGTLNRDSLIGFQMDGQITPAWGVTIQAKAFPSDHRENGWDPKLTWAFLSWRPTNDLLLRAGKLRVPLMLYSANSDVGTTYPFARLPVDAYSVFPVTDVSGLAFSWSWFSGDNEWTLEGYGGRAHTDFRFYFRDGAPPVISAGPAYVGADANMAGLVLTLQQREHTWRMGLHRVEATANRGPFPSDYPYVSLAPGLGYYQTWSTLPGPGVPMVNVLHVNVLTLSASIALPNDFRLIGEYARRQLTNLTIGMDTNAGYLALLRPIEKWTPYVYVAGIRSSDKSLDLYKAMNRSRVPDFLPYASLINASQRLGADQLLPYDQYTIAIGTSYDVTPNSKLKAEWAHTRSETASSFIDAPAGEDSGDREVNVFSLSYNFTF